MGTTSRSSDHSSSESKNMDPILDINNISVTFDMDRGMSRVLNNVSMDIKREEIIGVVGESGSGKSMFASALLDAVVEPGNLSGEINYYPSENSSERIDILNLNEEELRELRWEEISMVFQGAMSSFNPTQTFRTHFVETIRAHGENVDGQLEHARDLLSDLYLDPDRVFESYPHELSGGMKQRALIALSLVMEPNVLVMDEPTAALDLLMQRSILSLLEDLKEEYDLTVVFITHDLPLVAGLADRLAVLYAFEFVEVGDADKTLADPKHPYTRALLRAIPNLDLPPSEMQPIEGVSPDPVNIPEGCSYHPRCPLADEQCKSTDPHHYETNDDRTVACHYWERSPKEIPMNIDGEQEAGTSEQGNQSEKPILSLNKVDVHFEETPGMFSIFGESDIVHAVDDVDLEIYENDVVALVGESGCGKTTLGKTVIGVQEPTNGTIKYQDQDIWEAKRKIRSTEIQFEDIRRALQMVHQDPGASLNSNRTIKSILAAPLKRWYGDLTLHDRTARIRTMLKTVGMTPADDYINRYPHQLSGGEKQRVALIRALLMNPDLILADEAVSALDVSLRVEMMDLMLDLQDSFDTSYLFISHNLSNARYLASRAGGRIGVMYLGEIVELGPAEQIINDPQHPYTKVLQWSTADLEGEQENEEPPVRGIDIPDPVNPPSGCRFHTRCPYATEVCREQNPEMESKETDSDHQTACFRVYDKDHPYWNSEPLEDGVDNIEDPPSN